jgi:MoxR-vWA-beta-propeller ternary system domain bpX5
LSLPEPQVRLTWRPRCRPLAPIAAAAAGHASRALAARVLDRGDDALARLRGLAGAGVLVLIGEEDQLPWVDGVVYLGRDSLSPALLLPTSREPLLPPSLLERAVLSHLRRPETPVALLADPPVILSTGSARPVDRARLRTWLEGQI